MMTKIISKIKENYKHLEKNSRARKNLYDKQYIDNLLFEQDAHILQSQASPKDIKNSFLSHF